MRSFHGLVPAFIAALSLAVTGILAQSEEQVYFGIQSLDDAASELRFNISLITNDTFSTASRVGVHQEAALSCASS